MSDQVSNGIEKQQRESPDPSRAIALAQQLCRSGQLVQAWLLIEQALMTNPNDFELLALKEDTVRKVLQEDPDLVSLELAAFLNPDHSELQLDLGVAYLARRRPEDAERQFKTALKLGRALEAHAELASLYLSEDMPDAAESHAKAVLTLSLKDKCDQTCLSMAYQVLARIAALSEKKDEEQAYLDAAFSHNNLFLQKAANSRLTVLVPNTCRNGNISYGDIMPYHLYERWVWYMEYAHEEQFANLPGHDIIFNIMGDPDLAEKPLLILDSYLDQIKTPVLNPPKAVLASRRDRLMTTLAGIDGNVIPLTLRVSSGRLAQDKQGFWQDNGAMLIRPLGTHGGKGLLKLDDFEALQAQAKSFETGFLYHSVS